jgi:hypothetical protein
MNRRILFLALGVAALCAVLALGAISQATCAPFDYQCKFSKGGWSDADWMLVKSPSWDYFGSWVQERDHIRNATVGTSAKEIEATNSYTSMVLTHKVGGAVEISSTMSFDFRWAPLIVIADELSKSKDGKPEYRKHTEIVLYNEGLNIWQHSCNDGKPSYIRLAWSKLKFLPKHRYDLRVAISGKVMTVTVGGHELGCTNLDLPDDFYVGITGCEGINRFYDFKVHAER